MEELFKRFPFAAIKVFENLGNQSLCKSKEIDENVKEFLDNKQLVCVRIIKMYNGNLIQFKKSWIKFVSNSSTEIVKELALIIQRFFAKKSERYEQG